MTLNMTKDYNINEKKLLINNSNMICQGHTTKKVKCKNNVIIGYNYCHLHINGRCKYQIKKKGVITNCELLITKKFNNSDYCTLHHKKTMFKTDNCPICMEKFTDNSRPLKKCHHWIHKKCIIKSGKDECPICRTSQPGLNKKELKRLRKRKIKMKADTEREDEKAAEEYQEYEENSDDEVVVTTGSELLSMISSLRDEFVDRYGDERIVRLYFDYGQFREMMDSGNINILNHAPMETVQTESTSNNNSTNNFTSPIIPPPTNNNQSNNRMDTS